MDGADVHADLIEQGMTKLDMIAFKFPLPVWKSQLVFLKEGGILNGPIQFNAMDFRLLGWNTNDVKRRFDLNAEEMKLFEIDPCPVIDSRRISKHTARPVKKEGSSYDDLFSAP